MAEWLFSSGGHTHVADFSERERLSFRHGASKAYLEEQPIFPGFWLYRGEATAGCRFKIEVDGGEAKRGRLILGAILTSRGVASLEGCGDEVWREDGRSYVMTPVERRAAYEVDAHHGWRSVAVRLEPEALDILAGEAVPELLVESLDRCRDNVLDMAALPTRLRLVAQELLQPAFRGPMNRIFRQAKTLEFLAHQFGVLERSGQAEEALPVRDLAKVRVAHERLLHDLREPPDLDALAKDVGLSPKRLNRGFRELYGTTVFAFLRDARLEAARKALEAGTPLPLKQLAWELGYQQVSNFVTAFRRRFGVTPGAWKRGETEV
jgi:AraC-like DNA-binding protein